MMKHIALALILLLILLSSCAPPTGSSPAANPPSPAGQLAAQPSPAPGPPQHVTISFPGPGTLIFLPFEVAKAQGFFAQHGLDPEFSYTRGGPPAGNALVSRSVDFAGVSIDLALGIASQGRQITMIASSTRLPAFAVVTAPDTASSLTSLANLSGKTVGVANLGAGDQIITTFLLRRAGVDPDSIEWSAIGTDQAKIAALQAGHIDAALVQEPALGLLTGRGARVLANLYDAEQARAAFGGDYQFTGLSMLEDDLRARPELAARAAAAIADADRFIAANPGEKILEGVSDEAIVGDRPTFAQIIDRYKAAIFSPDGSMNPSGVDAVVRVQSESGLLTGPPPDLSRFFTNQFVAGRP